MLVLIRSTIVDVGQDEATACSLLKSMALKIHELVGAQMHHLSVCQWEVKLKLDCDGPASGTWRVVTTNVTSHTCTIDVSCPYCFHILYYTTCGCFIFRTIVPFNYDLKHIALILVLDIPGSGRY
jgi:hypothetical protein